MDLGINGKIALVTAASRGLGRGCAQQLAAEKCRVAICSRDEAAAKQAAKEIADQSGAGLTGFLKTISTELAPFGITVNALLPGTHKTSRIDQLVKDTAARENKPEEEVLREMMDAIPCKTIGDPADFGAAAAFLAGTRARYITGQNLLIDGGRYSGLL